MNKQPPKRIVVYRLLGTLLLSIGSILGCLLSSRVTRTFVESRAAQQSTYLVIARTPTRGLPSATPLPDATLYVLLAVLAIILMLVGWRLSRRASRLQGV